MFVNVLRMVVGGCDPPPPPPVESRQRHSQHVIILQKLKRESSGGNGAARPTTHIIVRLVRISAIQPKLTSTMCPLILWVSGHLSHLLQLGSSSATFCKWRKFSSFSSPVPRMKHRCRETLVAKPITAQQIVTGRL